jgi:hypothetical protein
MFPPPAQVQPDGSYRLACDTALATCLAPFDKCRHGFDIVRAIEERHRRGPEPAQETVSSEAVLRCRELTMMFGKAAQSPAVAAPAADKAAATACFPGATQGCLGSGACQGAQVCLASGTAFGPCDCGPARGGAPTPPGNPPPTDPSNAAPTDAGAR